MDEIGRLLPQDGPFPQRFSYEIDLEVREVPEPAVDQARGLGRDARGKVPLFKQQTGQPPQRRIPRNARPGDAAADDDEVVEKIRGSAVCIYHRYGQSSLEAVHDFF